MCVDLLARRRTVGILTGARGMVEIDRRGAGWWVDRSARRGGMVFRAAPTGISVPISRRGTSRNDLLTSRMVPAATVFRFRGANQPVVD
jgi:hypothetical protein